MSQSPTKAGLMLLMDNLGVCRVISGAHQVSDYEEAESPPPKKKKKIHQDYNAAVTKKWRGVPRTK